MRAGLAALILIVFASAAAAQPASESRGSVSMIGGFGKTFDDEGSLGRGWLVGGAIDRVLFGKTRAEISLELVTHDRDSDFFISTGRTITGGLSLVRRFGTGDAQPYLFAGLTAGHHSGTNLLSRRTGIRLSSTDAGLRCGFGVAIRAGRRYEISPEIRLNGFFIDNDSDPATLPSFGIRVGWRM